MNFHKRIKEQLTDTRNRAGQGKVIVDATCLRLLIEDFESLDERHRLANAINNRDDFEHFEHAIKSAYFGDKKNFGDIFLQVSEILKPLIEEDFKRDIASI